MTLPIINAISAFESVRLPGPDATGSDAQSLSASALVAVPVDMIQDSIGDAAAMDMDFAAEFETEVTEQVSEQYRFRFNCLSPYIYFAFA